MESILYGLIYIVLAPFVGGLLAGVDRIITARMQRRVGPPLLQPFYDVLKLLQKKTIQTNRFQAPYVICHLIFMVFTGFLFFEGSDILLTFFVLAVSSIFFILAAYSSKSPFSFLGAERELLLVMAYEPMVLITLVGFFKITGSFHVYHIIASGIPMIVYLPGIFLGFLYILTIKFRKSPFDLSYSHHAHQEIVKGITTDMTGSTLAMIEIAHWYENVFLLGFIFMFFSFNIWIGIGVTLAVYFLEILIDNAFAREKWEFVLRTSWIAAFLLGGGNLVLLYIFYR
ncbi:MAG: Ech hydrogenase subunit EchB [Spirochaetes bacterium GWF1_51_8]|nr:MAG: Ech hydrogenase subunit EchB [Spirochaetes bacterium GWF1_51_8]